VRVARILPQLRGELGDLSGQHRHLRHQRRDLSVEIEDPRVLRGDDGFQLGNPVLRVQRPT